MSSQTALPTESDIFRRALEAQPAGMTPDVARFFLSMSLAPPDAARVCELSSKANAGELTPSEERELDEYLRHGRLMETLQLRARRILNQAAE
jgi:hypothetical protein